jgi:hypothetical protein
MRYWPRHFASAFLVTFCCAASGLAHTGSGADNDAETTVNTPAFDITRHATPLPDVTALPVPSEPRSPASQAGSEQATPADSANPLWAIPLSTLTATRDRPLYAPSRRPPAPVVANAPVLAPPPPPPPPPEHPDLTLVGTVKSEISDIVMTAAIAVFIEEGSRKSIRLRIGEAHNGWVLQSVARGAAILQKGLQSETLRLRNATAARGPATAAELAATRPAYVPGR